MKHAFLVVALLIAVPISSQGEILVTTYATKDHFTINLPANWNPIPQNSLKRVSPTRYYKYGYQESSGGNWFSNTPFILIHVSSDKRLKESAFRNVGNMTQNIHHELLEFTFASGFSIMGHEVDDAFYDDENNIFYSTITMTQPDNRETYILMATMLTELGHIEISFYLNDNDDFDSYYALFEKIIQNVELEEKLEYHPRFSDHFLLFRDFQNKLKAYQKPKYAILLLIFCLVIWRMRVRFKA